MNWIKENIWFLLFFIWSFPMGYYRSQFRKIVYETDDWKINIKPVFIKEMRGLFGNVLPEDEEYLKMRNFYRFYLIIYVGLFLAWRFF